MRVPTFQGSNYYLLIFIKWVAVEDVLSVDMYDFKSEIFYQFKNSKTLLVPLK